MMLARTISEVMSAINTMITTVIDVVGDTDESEE